MALTITYGGVTCPNATLARTLTSIPDDDGLTTIGTTETWVITGTIVATTLASIKTAWDTLKTAFDSDAGDVQWSDGVTSDSLATADCRGGTRVTQRLTHPDTNGGGALVTNLPYSATVSGDIYDTTGTVFISETTTYDIGQNGKTTQTLSGELRTDDSTSADTEAQARDPGTPAGYQRMGYSRTINDDDNQATYTYTDWEYWVVLDSGTTDGGYTTSRSYGEEGTQIVRVSGSFTGTGAQAAADAAKIVDAAYDTTNEEQTVNTYDGSVSFSYEYVDRGATGSYMSFTETISLQYGGDDFILQTVLNDEEPRKIDTVKRPYVVTQSGEAVGTVRLAAATPKYSTANRKPGYTNVWTGPVKGPNGETTRYRTTWSYTFEFPDAQTLVEPTTTP